jgi:hypothetical protein
MANFDALKLGLLLFNHVYERCKTTLALEAGEFIDLYKKEIFQTRMTGTKECPGYCLYKENLQPCPANCECAYIREVIQIIRSWPKKPAPG